MFAAESANIVAGCVTERKAQLLGRGDGEGMGGE